MSRLSIDDIDELRRTSATVATQSVAVDAARNAALGAARGAEEEARRLLTELRQRVNAAQAALAACDADDPARGYLTGRLRAAEERQRRGEALSRQVSRQVGDLHQYCSAQAQRQHRLAERLGAVHSAVVEDIDKARGILMARDPSGTTASLGSWQSAVPSSPTTRAPEGVATIGGTRMHRVPLSSVETSIEHVRGPQDFTKMSIGDMRVALNLLEARVQPAVAAGATRDDLVGLDRERGMANAPVTHAGVYDLFYGSDRIRLDRNRDGTFSVTNGGHRIWLARRMGITELPADIGGNP